MTSATCSRGTAPSDRSAKNVRALWDASTLSFPDYGEEVYPRVVVVGAGRLSLFRKIRALRSRRQALRRGRAAAAAAGTVVVDDEEEDRTAVERWKRLYPVEIPPWFQRKH